MLLDNFLRSSVLFQVTALLYLPSVILFLIGLIGKKEKFSKTALMFLGAAFVSNTVLIVHAWMIAGRAPFKTLYETMLFYPWCVELVFFILYGLYRLTILGPFASLISLIGFGYACYDPDVEIVNLPPALQSVWFVPHVVTYFISYGALFLSFSLAVLYLLYPDWRKGNSSTGFEKFYNEALNFGFVALTFGLILGSAWGKVAWGDYWGWDPKENWALITWLIYLATIHLRFIKGWKGKKAALVSIIGFLAVIFTYLGMTLLPTAENSLHVYQ